MPDIADALAFFQPGVSQIVFMDAVAAATMVPTGTEISGGLNLMSELYDAPGWSKSTSWIERRKGNRRERTQMAGATTFAQSSIIFTMDKAGADAAAEFEEGQTGFILKADRGLVAALPGEMFQVEVGAVTPITFYDGSDYPRIQVDFGINRYEKITIPTLA